MKTEELVAQLQNAGIEKGDRLIVHSSLNAIGANAEMVIEALTQTIGSEGTLLMPAFSYCYELRPGVEPFDVASTPSMTGMLTEVFRKYPGTLRSVHPTHSVSVWGTQAKYIAALHQVDTPAFDEGTPFDILAKMGAKILLAGVDLTACSIIHVAEFAIRLSFLHIPNRPEFGFRTLISGIDPLPLPCRLTGCSKHFNILEQLPGYQLLGANDFQFGKAMCKLIPANPLLNYAIALLKKDPTALLCPAGTCVNCDRRRAVIAREKEGNLYEKAY